MGGGIIFTSSILALMFHFIVSCPNLTIQPELLPVPELANWSHLQKRIDLSFQKNINYFQVYFRRCRSTKGKMVLETDINKRPPSVSKVPPCICSIAPKFNKQSIRRHLTGVSPENGYHTKNPTNKVRHLGSGLPHPATDTDHSYIGR